MTFPRPIHMIPVGPAVYARFESTRLPPELGRDGNEQ
jgi:hypothetical protein